MTDSINTTTSTSIELLDLTAKLSMKDLAMKINEIIEATNKLSTSTQPARNRGPASETAMTEEHARRVMLGDLKDVSHKEAAELLSLSYGQIYSARKGFTFKPVYKEMVEAQKAA